MREPAHRPTNNGGAAYTGSCTDDQKGFAMTFTTVTSLRTSLAERRATRARRRRLAHELASYRTPAERLELDLILGRHSAEETAEIDAILSRQTASIPYPLGA